MSSYSSYNSTASTDAAAANAAALAGPWQEKLEERCREARIRAPVFQDVSDRRGGRTAWSSTVVVGAPVQGQAQFCARYWYDGKNVKNAREDAAEVALKHLNGSSPTSPTQSRNGY